MTAPLPPMVTFTELILTALGTATQRVAEGSRRNAHDAMTARRREALAGSEALAALSPIATPSRTSA